MSNNATANDAARNKFPYPTMAASSGPHWPSSKDPSVVHVPRNFGDKDRHSKVTTTRGRVRDRRIRLSAVTAIQLYDLQERLGIRQPSKAVDWLLDVAKKNIDSLPPLPGLKSQPTTTTLDNVAADHHRRFSEVPPNILPYNNFSGIWDPPNLSLSQFGGGFPFTPHPHTYDEEKYRSLTPTSTKSQPCSCPSASPSIFPPFFSHNGTPSMEINDHSRQLNFLED